ncbi:DUF2635 domain-containing protein [Chromobacterium amazonense]|uniref:DUF2635 domain-containing protein n=1 Tax=Chromobacterium amazonense TaxID=1382803 RepID=UPI00237DF15D|nr:DUF2635 domain-containing protein [Chromobacterium amazonense]MDE1715744.1 DUF2635 domain-containing protein [Chromobacterium amazonense]
MYVKPKDGLVIRDPDLLDLLPVAGREVPETDYWYRRLRDGDVALASAEAPADVAAPAKKGGDK